jgi:Pyruvate/2-oxoacid:ferredoxin oxidoreductase delta subunit
MAPGHIVLYYFSGTGNARHVAHWFAGEAGRRHIPCQVTDISRMDRRKIPSLPPGTLVGFISPTHGFNFPPVMMYFLFRFPRGRRNSAFVVNTRAGLKLSRWYLPGLSGITLWLGALVLLIKGYRIRGLRSIDLPSNWISLHPGLKVQVVTSIYDRCQKITRAFAEKIVGGKTVLPAFRDILQDLLVAPVSIAYFFIGRFVLAKTFYANEHCDLCGICQKGCPVGAILKVDNRPFWSYRCESCMRCMNTCPNRAIDTAHGFLAGALFLINLVVLVYFWKMVSLVIMPPADEGWMVVPYTIIRWILTFASMVICYRLFHFLLRIPIVREVFFYTSLTRLKGWRRYKAPAEKTPAGP